MRRGPLLDSRAATALGLQVHSLEALQVVYSGYTIASALGVLVLTALRLGQAFGHSRGGEVAAAIQDPGGSWSRVLGWIGGVTTDQDERPVHP